MSAATTSETASATVFARYRGPFRLLVLREFTTKKGCYRSVWLRGAVDRDDVEAEVQALLDDPRDRIAQISVWSQRDQQFVMSYRNLQGASR